MSTTHVATRACFMTLAAFSLLLILAPECLLLRAQIINSFERRRALSHRMAKLMPTRETNWGECSTCGGRKIGI